MKLRTYFFILTLLLSVILTIMLVVISGNRNVAFYIAEALIAVSVIFLYIFYRKVVKPLDIIANGMDLLKEQDFSSRLTPVGQSEADRIVDIFNRMMGQLKEERLRVREQNNFLDLLISASPMGVIILSFDEKISMANRAALGFLGIENEDDIKKKSLNDLNSPLSQEICEMAKESTRTIRLNDSMIYRCSSLSFYDRGFMHPFILIESLTSEVIKAEKIAYEKVIRMIAHEVNNTVAGISSTLDSVCSALEVIENTEDLRDVMRICVERSLSMSNFITSFANVVKIPEPQLELVSLNERVSACKIFMENACRENDINLNLELSSDNPSVYLDTVLFEQVIVNIIKNSAESINKCGDIYIRTFSYPSVLEIADTGSGISKDVEAKLFSPFFSTKPNGQGIGLLFIREVLTKHHCKFSLRTGNDGITKFSIYFN